MYKCDDCGRIFDETKTYSEDFTPDGSFEGGSFLYHFEGCPYCESTDYYALEECSECWFMSKEKDGEYIFGEFVCKDCLERKDKNG